MRLTSHHDVHPWRHRAAVIALALCLIALAAMLWNSRQAADTIEQTVWHWIDLAGGR